MHASSVAMAFSHAWQPYNDKKPWHRAMDIPHARGMDFHPGTLRISRSIGDVFFVGVFAQVITLASIVFKALFPKPAKDMLTQLMELLNNGERNDLP